MHLISLGGGNMQIADIIQDSIDFIENNLKSDITLSELSTSAGYSKYHFSRIFKSLTGLSVMEYVNRRKLIHSSFEISKGAKVIDIALSYGFDTGTGFYKAFKKEFGCSPTDFIKKHIACKPYKINLLQEEHIMITHKKLTMVLKSWNLHNAQISDYYHINTLRRSENIWLIDNKYFLKVTTNPMTIKNQAEIYKILQNSKILTASPIKTVNGDLYFTDDELYFTLTEKINAEPLKSTDFYNNNKLCFEVGTAIGQLHKTLAKQDIICDEHCIISEAICCLDNAKQIAELSTSFCLKLKSELEIFEGKLPSQIIHRDLNPENILISENNYGFIDFDITEKNIRIFDICYCATAMLSETFNSESYDNDKWGDILDNLVKGYDDVIQITPYEKHAIPYVICSIQIICINYFSKFDKYKELTQTNIKILEYIIAKFFQ